MITTPIKPTKAGWRLLLGAAGFTVIVALLTARWVLEYVDKGVQRMTISIFILLLLAIMGIAYGVGWLILHFRGISVRKA